MRQIISRFFIPILFGSLIAAMSMAGSSCKKELLLQDGGELRFSTDTLTFDTVFTSLGSATIGVKIFNPQDKKINISSVRLAGGTTSFFHLNVDGKSGDGSNIEVAAKDSIYVFATVTVDPTNENTPFIVEDRLVATLNGQDFSIPIIAYGQNAYYIRDSVLDTRLPWVTNKPYVIFGYAIVDSNKTLTIPPGCRIYMHANARLFMIGTLKAIGTKKDSIIFQGDRLDRSYFGYEGYPGEWGGLYFDSYSTANVLRHVIIRNCGNGAQGAPSAAIQVAPDKVHGIEKQLTLDKTIIENSIGYGLLSFGGTVRAENCLIHSCGATALALVQGGDYELYNCTIATYGNNKINHTDDPVAVIRNFYFTDELHHTSAPLTAVLQNCTITGSLDNEFVADSLEDAPTPARISLQNCLLKAEQDKIRPWIVQTNVQYNKDPAFTDITKWNYRPKVKSPLIDSGATYPNISATDLDEQMRSYNSVPDIGCYEFQ